MIKRKCRKCLNVGTVGVYLGNNKWTTRKCPVCKGKGEVKHSTDGEGFKMNNPVEKWYAYGTIRNSKEQIIWVLKNIEFFEEGTWPPEPPMYETEFYDKELKTFVPIRRTKSVAIEQPTKKKRVKKEAYFIKPKDIIAEINFRLDRCEDAVIFRAFYCDGDGAEKLAQLVGCDELDVWGRLDRVMNYITGTRRKKGTQKESEGHRRSMGRFNRQDLTNTQIRERAKRKRNRRR